jgi:hypothetical protein
MSATTDPNRRQFLRNTTAGGFALGGLLGLGFDLLAAQAETSRLKNANTREVPSVCPYCAVGCGQLVAVRDNRIVSIEGNPDNPISRGTLCPKGTATYQLAVNDFSQALQPLGLMAITQTRRGRLLRSAGRAGQPECAHQFRSCCLPPGGILPPKPSEMRCPRIMPRTIAC